MNGELSALVRHFVDLRDGTHAGSVSRADKETHFVREAELLAPFARQALTELDETLLLRTGMLAESGVARAADGGLEASWSLSWPEQRAAGISPIAINAYYGAGFHHPHLRGSTVRDWPLNIGSEGDAADQLPISCRYCGQSWQPTCTTSCSRPTSASSQRSLLSRNNLALRNEHESLTRSSPISCVGGTRIGKQRIALDVLVSERHGEDLFQEKG